MSQAIDLEIRSSEKVKANLNHEHRKQSKDFIDWVDRFLKGVDYTKYNT